MSGMSEATQIEQLGLDFRTLWEYIQKQSASPKKANGELRENPLDGIYFKYKCSKMKGDSKKMQVFSQGITIGHEQMLMITLRDMSTWLEVEKQKNISTTKTIVFAQAAHEFRNPLNGISAFLEILANEIPNPQEN